jgi:DNA invertase Pin-like site-specific DNA recombinase
MTKRAVIYARVNTEQQMNEHSLPIQIDLGQRYAKEQGYEVGHVFQEWCSGIDLNRPVLNKLYEILEKEGFEILIVQDVNRLSRDVNQLIIIYSELARYDVEIECVLGGSIKTAEYPLRKPIKTENAQYKNCQCVKCLRSANS